MGSIKNLIATLGQNARCAAKELRSASTKQKGEKAEIIDVNPNSIRFTDKKQDKPKNPLSEAKANELKKAYANDAAKNQDNKQPSNEAKQNKRIRTSQA